MPAAGHQHSSSYRDPSGFVFNKDGVVYRQVNKRFQKDFDFLISSGLYQQLAGKDILIPHREIDENITGNADWYKTLQPDFIPFISYPYEWSFDMLKDAALLTLHAAREAMGYGMMLKDASSFNVQLHKGKMIFIDTLSFEIYDETKPWIAYRQFCEQFYAPLALMHYLQEPVQNMLVGHAAALPLRLTKKLLPFKSKLNLHTYLHLHLHAGMSGKAAKNKVTSNSFTKQKMQNLLQSLEQGIRSFHYNAPSGEWSGYYHEALQRHDYLEQKESIVSDFLTRINFKTAFDAGANEGVFSMLLQAKADLVVSADMDHFSVNRLYNTVKQQQNSSLHPVMVDLANPSPAIGLLNTERSSFLERLQVDVVLALAVIHHLAIGRNIPFSRIAEMFSRLGRYLVIEFVPKQDEKIQLMLQQKKDVYTDYDASKFLQCFQQFFVVLEQQVVGDSGRTIYLMERK